MKKKVPMTVAFGDLVLAIYDEAEQHSADPVEVSRLATQTVQQILWHAPKRKPKLLRIFN